MAAVPTGYYLGRISPIGSVVCVSIMCPFHNEILRRISDCGEGRVHPRGAGSPTCTSIGVHMFPKRGGGRNGGILMPFEGESVPAGGQIVVAIITVFALCTVLDRSPRFG